MCCGATNSPEGMMSGELDVCKTTVGPAVVPIPYPLVAELVEADPATLAVTVLFEGFPVVTEESIAAMSCEGDEAGDLMGLESETISMSCRFLLGSTSVFAEGGPVCYFGGMTMMNGEGLENCMLADHDTPSQETVMVAP
jgi:Domain of unknown function (DUF4150)